MGACSPATAIDSYVLNARREDTHIGSFTGSCNSRRLATAYRKATRHHEPAINLHPIVNPPEKSHEHRNIQ
jgi:hypothetical protein